jgi:hypothetical protein
LPPEQSVKPIPPGPSAAELADYAIAQTQYRYGLATGDADAISDATMTFWQIPREIFSRQDPRLFAAVLVCEAYRGQTPAATGETTSSPSQLRCQSVEQRYNEATIAIRRDVEAKIAAANSATIAQAGAGRR